jgi:hypothetical protein
VSSVISATAQDPDVLILNRKAYDLYSNPLEPYYSKDNRPRFWVEPNTVSSGNWRGYTATWEITDGKLYLTKIDSWFCSRLIKTRSGCRRVTLRDLFGKKAVAGKVLASWVTDKLRVPDGKQLKYVHSGYASIYERNIIFDINDGKIVNQESIDNTKEDLPSDQEAYQQELERFRKKGSREELANSNSSGIAKANENRTPIVITDKGWGTVSVGTKREVVETQLGQGEHDGRKYEDVYFVEYPKRGIQISYTNKTGEVYAIFFYNKQTYYGNFTPALVKTDKGITWNSSPEDVIKAYGKPPRDFSDETGNNRWRRLEYDKIDFLFEGGIMTRISISNEMCTGCKK